MAMKILRAAAMLVMLSGPAYAQMPDVNIIPQERPKTPDEIERDRQLDKAYRDSLRKIPDAKAVNDPWGSVRSAETPAAATPRAKSQAKQRASQQ
jgi:hypothetical protein